MMDIDVIFKKIHNDMVCRIVLIMCFLTLVFVNPLNAENVHYLMSTPVSSIQAAYWGIKSVEQGRRQLKLLHTHGLNTALVKDGSFQIDLALWKAWGKVSGAYDIRLLPVLNFAGPSEIKNLKGKYLPYIDRAGRVFETTPCPLDKTYWKAAIEQRFLQLASAPIAGIVFDTEMYGGKMAVYRDFCFCDRCWQRFFNRIRQKMPEILKEQRFHYLSRNGMLDRYAKFQEKQLRAILAHIEQQVHAINPSLAIGFLSYQNNWFYQTLIRGLGTHTNPVLVFSENSYILGYTPYILQENQSIAGLQSGNNKQAIAWHIPGVWLGRFFPEDLPSQLYNLGVHTQGYWLFTVDSLWSEAHQSGPYALHGSHDEYWLAFQEANDHLEGFDRDPASYRSSLPPIYQSSFYDQVQELLITPPSLQLFMREVASEENSADIQKRLGLASKKISYREKVLFHCFKSPSRSHAASINITHSPVGKRQTDTVYRIFDSEGQPFLEGSLSAENPSVDLSIPSNISGTISLLINSGANIARVSFSGLPCTVEASPTFPLSTNNTIQRYAFHVKPEQQQITLQAYCTPGEAASLSVQSPEKNVIKRYAIVDRVETKVTIPDFLRSPSTIPPEPQNELKISSNSWEMAVAPLPSEPFDDIHLYFYNNEFPYLIILNEASSQ